MMTRGKIQGSPCSHLASRDPEQHVKSVAEVQVSVRGRGGKRWELYMLKP